MSVVQITKCDCCGKAVEPVGVRFAGVWQGQCIAASGGVSSWHACSAACAAKHVESVLAALRARVEEERKAPPPALGSKAIG